MGLVFICQIFIMNTVLYKVKRLSYDAKRSRLNIMAAKQYTSDNIKVLNDIEHIQLRSGMYIGEATDARSLFSEMFDNAMDEVSAKHSPELVVTVDTKENRYTVRDFGRGIPHG